MQVDYNARPEGAVFWLAPYHLSHDKEQRSSPNQGPACVQENRMNQNDFNQQLLDFLYRSPTPFHAVKNMAKILESRGFQQLSENDSWTLSEGGRYYVTRNGTAIVAFVMGQPEQGFRMAGAHTDSPCLKVKPTPEKNTLGYLQLGVEVYGGALLNPWFDRDLSLAGRVQYLDRNSRLNSQLVNFNKPIAIIPSLAIHLDREANNKRSVNPQTDIPPVLGLLAAEEKADFRALLKDQLISDGHDDCQDVLSFDLSFYDTQRPAIIGLNDEFIASARLDNLLSCFVGLQSLIQHQSGQATALLVCNDHEEVGSQSATGAQGPLLKHVLERISGTGAALSQAISRSMLISTDNAHGIHPNFSDRHDDNHGPRLNDGVVIKVNANQRYATTDATSGLFQLLCRQAGTRFQYFVSRTDMGCGSTIGPLTAGEIGLRTLDIGLPTFAMHSIRELAGTQDAFELSRILTTFFALENLPG